MPIVEANINLLQYVQDMGYFQNTGAGLVPLSFQEIKAYIDLMKLNLSIWEISTLREMSASYISQYNSNYIDTEAPFGDKKAQQITSSQLLSSWGFSK